MIPAKVVREYLTRTFETQSKGLSVYWIRTLASRRELCTEVIDGLGDTPILPIIVESGRFQDADGVMDDLNSALLQSVEWFSADRRSSIARELRITILLVSRRSLGVPQLSSPVELPDWFPVWPGNLLNVTIREITSSIDVHLSDPAVDVAAIRAGLASIEVAVLERVDLVVRRNRRAVDSLWSRLKLDEPSGDSLEALLRTSKSVVSELSEPSAFRPGAADSRLLISRLFRAWLRTSPDALHALSVSLAQAMEIEDSKTLPRQFSLASLLMRPNSPPISQLSAGVLFCRNVIVSLAQGTQFSTAAAHAADYPRFPYLLLTEYALNLSRSCSDAAAAIRQLDC